MSEIECCCDKFYFKFRSQIIIFLNENVSVDVDSLATQGKILMIYQLIFNHTLFQVTLESKDAELKQDVLGIFQFLAHTNSHEQAIHLLHLLLANLNDLENILDWSSLIGVLFRKLYQDGHCSSETERSLISVTEKVINSFETESPTSVDKNLNLLVGSVKLISSAPFLHQKISNFPAVLSCAENLLKSKIPADKRQVLLKVAPFLTEVNSCSSWSGTKICSSLACIELKLALEELVHRFEESGEVEATEICAGSVVACCETIENCISEMVDENSQLGGEILQSMIDDIRMAMTSTMFYLQKGLHKQDTFVPTLRLFMRWLSDDSADVNEIISTFRALKDFYSFAQNYSEYGGFLVSAVIFQMEDKKFREFVKTDLAYFLIEISLLGLLSAKCLVLAPIFNDLLTYDIFLNMRKVSGNDQVSQSLCSLFCHEDKALSAFSLCRIQVSSYLILCLSKRNQSMQSVCEHYTVSGWTCRAVNYLLSPFQGNRPPGDWLDLKDIWLSSVHSICELIEKSSEEVLFDGVNMDVLIRKSVNYSEIGDEISGALEDLLSLIVSSS